MTFRPHPDRDHVKPGITGVETLLFEIMKGNL
jgi:hypothetical protein